MLLVSIAAAWWLIAEAAILLAADWGWRYLAGSSSRTVRCVVVGIVIFSLALLIARLAHPWFNTQFRWSLVWNFLCTVWVGLEAAILIYLARIVRHICGKPSIILHCGFIAIGLSVIFIGWHIPFAGLLDQINDGAIRNIAAAYVRLCGIFWIGIEFGMAWWLWQARRIVMARL